MKNFSDLNIKISDDIFIGNKIKINRILNKEIIVSKFKIEKSKCFKGECLTLQISFEDDKHIIFTSGVALIEAMRQIPENEIPFKTKIIKQNERYLFS